MMGWYGGGALWPMMIGGTVLWLLLIGVVVWVVARAIPSRSRPPEDPRMTLDRRFAAGELDVDAYREAVRELTASGRI